MKILIVDDEDVTRETFRLHLEKFGECVPAADGARAVEAVTAAYDAGAPFDLAFLDISMPVMDGREALSRIRALEKERGVRDRDALSVVMATSHDDLDMVAASFFEGRVAMYVTKPLDFDGLEAELKKEGLI